MTGRRFASIGLTRQRPALLQRLDGDAFARYVCGLADRASESGGRWFVYDCMANLLDNALADYTPDRLAAALEHHFEFQFNLYTLALHRCLRSRLPDYDYGRHIGGAAVVFLRGVRGESASGIHAMRRRRVGGGVGDGVRRVIGYDAL